MEGGNPILLQEYVLPKCIYVVTSTLHAVTNLLFRVESLDLDSELICTRWKFTELPRASAIHPGLAFSWRPWAPAPNGAVNTNTPTFRETSGTKAIPAALEGDLAALYLGKLQTWKFSARKAYLTKAQTRHLAPTLCDAGLPDWQENHSKELIMLLEQISRAVPGYFYFIIRYNMFRDAPTLDSF